MKKNITKRGIAIMSMVAIFGLGAYAYADRGMEYGHEGRHHGYGNQGNLAQHQMYEYNRSHMNQENLSDIQIYKLNHEYDVYLKETEGTRQELYQKEIELRNEMSKDEPNPNKVFAVQKEVSNLRSQIDSKALEFELMARKITPDNRAGHFDGNHMMGWGRGNMAGNDHMMGYGPGSGGNRNCW